MGRSRSVPPTLEVALQNGARYPELDARTLQAWLSKLVTTIAPDYESVTVRLCGERSMRAMNRDYRGHDQVTDVLSFPGDDATEPGHLGDVVVCVAQARRQAAARGVSLELEMKTLFLHGVLHCMGHDHETDHGEMERLEKRLRRRWVLDG